MSFTQCPFLHHDEEDGNQNQDVDGGRNHAADDRRGNRLHHIGADAGFPENRNKTGKHSADGHKLWPQTMNGTFNGCVFNVSIRQRLTRLQFVFESFMKIDDHHDTGFYSNSEECDVTDRHSDAEVVVKKPLQEQPSTHRIDDWEDENKRFGDRAKDQVQQQEDHEEDHRKNQLQALLGTQFQFVLSRPLKRVICGQGEFVVEELICLCDEAPIVGVLEIDVNVASKRAIFIADHGRSMREGDPRYLTKLNLCARRSADQHPTHLLNIVAEVSLIADVDRIALASLDVLSDVLSADAG